MLHLHQADRLEPLIDAMAEILRVPPPDPFTPEIVVVPTVGMQDAAMAGIGRHLGIAANVEYLFPGRFLARAMGDTTPPGETEGDPWRLPRLTWAVLDELAAGEVQVPGNSPTGRWTLARHIADLFDRYATQRSRLIRTWADVGHEGGPDSDGTFDRDGVLQRLPESFAWQPRLWRRVRDRIGAPNPAERLPQLLDDIRAGAVTPQLPGRVMVFGVGGLAPTLLQVLSALSAQREVHVFLRHPSRAAWAATPHRLAGGLNLRDNVDVTTGVTHPLLASWGRPSLETRAILNHYEGVRDTVEGSTALTPPTTLLQALQHGIRADAAPKPVEGVAADGTVQVHACHGALRQLEVLRDVLGHAFIADPTLQPHEVLVLCPDIATYAPLVEAVFGRGSLPVPVVVGDRSLSTDEPVATALTQVLALVSGRATLSEVLAFVQLEPVRRRLGWGAEAVETAAQVVTDLGARWGLLPEHRAPWGVDGVADGTWRVVVDRLLAGIACSAPLPRTVVDGVAPYDDVNTDMFVVIGGLADLLQRLVHLHDEVLAPRPIDEWVALLHRVVDEFCAFDPKEPWRRQRVHRELDDIERSARRAVDPSTTCDVPLDLADVQTLLAQMLGERAGRVSLRSGSVTVTSMLPQHGVPARIVCILGLDEGVVRSGSFAGDDVLGLNPCVGERHPRYEGRQLLLDAVLAATERLVVTCTGADLTTNDDVPFTVPLAELLDTVEALVPGSLARVVVRHPRHGFNELALRPAALLPGIAQPFTFEPEMLTAALALRGAAVHEPLSWRLPPAAFERVDLDEVLASLANPARTYLRERLDVRLPSEDAAPDDGLAISVEPLVTSALGRELLDVQRRGGTDDDVEEWKAAARLAGGMPPRQLGAAVIDGVADTVADLVVLADAWQVPLAGTEEVQFEHGLVLDDLAGDGRPITLLARVRGVARDATRSRVVHVQASRLKPSHRLAMAVRVAAMQLHERDVDWSGVLIGRGEKVPEGTGMRVAGAGDQRVAAAKRLIDMAVQLHAWASCDAVPFFDQASEALGLGSLSRAADGLSKDFEYDAHRKLLWPDITFDGWLLEPVSPVDPQPVRNLAHTKSWGRAQAVATWVWSTLRECTEMIDQHGVAIDPTEGSVRGD